MPVGAAEQALAEVVEGNRRLYEESTIDTKLTRVIRVGPHSKLTKLDILRILRTSRSVYFDTHVEVVSGHHTGTYLRFESIARFPELIRQVAGDMAAWIKRTFQQHPITGLVATSSTAELLARGIAEVLDDAMGLRLALTPYSC